MIHMDYRFFEMARKASTFSDYPKRKIGCIVTYKNKVISVGYNCTKSHPLQAKYAKYRGIVTPMPVSLHAEMAALLKVKDMDIDWKRVSVYIFRTHKDGSLANCRPCNACMSLIKELGIKNIYYTNDEAFCHEEITSHTYGKVMNNAQEA